MKQNAKPLIQKISDNIKSLERDNLQLPSTFKEFMGHVKEQVNIIETESKKSDTKHHKKQPAQYFSVEQWSKEKAMTFFLGDEVGCCLATTNSQFQAMVQRRMDDAMLFHVAIDKITGRPAALIWLYLAETADGKVSLIANFFEVNAKYAVNDTYRMGLLNGLLHFTHQFCQDNPGIDAFYMNQLTYGWNINDLKSYPICQMKLIDKLGGPYIPGMSAEQIDMVDADTRQQIQSLTKQKYYLVSLYQTQFHRFYPEILAKNNDSSYLPLEDMIQKSVLEIAQKEKNINLDGMMKEIINRHQLELKPFYDKNVSIEKDPRFIFSISNAVVNLSFQVNVKEEAKQYLSQFTSQGIQNAATFFSREAEHQQSEVTPLSRPEIK